MKTLTFKENSWHHRLAKMGGFDWSCGDICSYTRKVMMGALGAILVSALALILLYLAVHMVMGIGFSLWYGMFLFTDAGFAGLVVVSIVSLVTGIFFLSDRLQKYNLENQYNDPGFVKTAYRSWKEKYCARIEIVKDEHDDNLRAGK
jgi:uncharacterized membrane protein